MHITLHIDLTSPHLNLCVARLPEHTYHTERIPTYLPSAHLPILNLQRSYHNIMSATSK